MGRPAIPPWPDRDGPLAGNFMVHRDSKAKDPLSRALRARGLHYPVLHLEKKCRQPEQKQGTLALDFCRLGVQQCATLSS